jgi:hypothetical protein
MDIEKIKGLALVAQDGSNPDRSTRAFSDFLGMVSNPATVLELIAEVERKDDELARLRDWFESQRKAISKGAGSTWDMCQCSDQTERIDAAIAAHSKAGKEPA